jgi:hypothetical protein
MPLQRYLVSEKEGGHLLSPSLQNTQTFLQIVKIKRNKQSKIEMLSLDNLKKREHLFSLPLKGCLQAIDFLSCSHRILILRSLLLILF